MAPGKAPEVSVVIPTFNDAEHVERCLRTLDEQTLPPDEVIVVDGHSDDGTDEIAETLGATVVYEDVGTIGAAYNLGAKQSRGDLVVYTDADAYFPETWLENLVGELRSREADVLGGEDVVEEDAPLFERALFVIDEVRETPEEGEAWGRIRTCNAAFRREPLLEELFDPGLTSIIDAELCYRLHSKGYRVLYDPGIEVYHRRRGGLRPLFIQLYRNGKGRAQAVEKHPAMFDVGLDFLPASLLMASLIGVALSLHSPLFLAIPAAILALFSLLMPIHAGIRTGKTWAIPVLMAALPVRWVGWSLGYMREMVVRVFRA